jgi:hypothetical protein
MTEYVISKPVLIDKMFVEVEPPHTREYPTRTGSITIHVEGMPSLVELLFDLEDALACGMVKEVSSETRLDIEGVLKELEE